MNQRVPCLQPEAMTSETPLGFKSRHTPEKALQEIRAELQPSFHPAAGAFWKAGNGKQGGDCRNL